MGGGGTVVVILFVLAAVWVKLACVPIRRFRSDHGGTSRAYRAVIAWLAVMVVLSVGAVIALSVPDPETWRLWAMFLGPGALIAAGRIARERVVLRRLRRAQRAQPVA